jgi:proliferating cell nuclear antigen PCNA
MLLRIEDKNNLEIFVAICQLLKQWSSHISMQFNKDKLYVQSMDKSHVCLTTITLKSKWFQYYECNEATNVCVDSSHFAVLMTYALKHSILELKFVAEEEPDKLYISFLNKKEEGEQGVDKKTKKKEASFEHFFELNLMDVDDIEMNIPAVDYEVDFNIETKKWVDVLNELNTIGQDLVIVCKEDLIELNVSGDAAKLKVHIPVGELNEYAIAEDSTLEVSYSLSHLSKMCCSTKLSLNVEVSLSNDYPMMLKYDLGQESSALFYIAPKIHN